MPQIARICTSVIHLSNGFPILISCDIKAALQSYYDLFDEGGQSESGTGCVTVLSTIIRSASGVDDAIDAPTIEYGGGIEVDVECIFQPGCDEATIQFVIWNQEMLPVIDVLGPMIRRFPISPGPARKAKIRATLASLQLNSGRFSLSVVLLSPDGKTVHCRLDRAAQFLVRSNSGSACHFTMLADWETITA